MALDLEPRRLFVTQDHTRPGRLVRGGLHAEQLFLAVTIHLLRIVAHRRLNNDVSHQISVSTIGNSRTTPPPAHDV
jgi:hypothetical protein